MVLKNNLETDHAEIELSQNTAIERSASKARTIVVQFKLFIYKAKNLIKPIQTYHQFGTPNRKSFYQTD